MVSSARAKILLVLALLCCQPTSEFKWPRKLDWTFTKKLVSRIFKPKTRQSFFDSSNSVPPRQSLDISPEAYLTSPEIIVRRGYPVQTYSVTTDDGYILELHRIPHGYGQSAYSGTTGYPVFLQHGFLDTSADWIINPSDRSLAFRLADLGYDVWLGNARGNTYSRKHTTYNPSSSFEYWNFSYDEMGRYDIPAVINYVLTVTGRSTLSYVGHSMGCAMFFIAMTYDTSLNSKIDVMIALGPATALANMRSPLRYLAPFVNPIEFWLVDVLRTRVFLSNDALLPRLQRRFCDQGVHREGLCRNSIMAIVGDDTRNMPLEILPVIDNHNPGGTSVHTAALFAQNYNSGDTFVPYDFGRRKNLERYGQAKPPPYDLSKVTCPVYIFYGQNDLLVVPEDVAWLASKLGNLKESIGIDYPLFNHFDFVWATDVNLLLYDKLITLLPSSSS